MRIAIISDIHDNIPKLKSALRRMQDVDELICCGDLCSPFIIKEMGEGFRGATHVVFGNNDADRFRITEAASQFEQIQLYGEFVELVLSGKRFAVNHFDDIGRAIAESEQFDVVCFGHNHQYEVTKLTRTMIINPGEIYGLLSGQSTFVIYETDSSEALRVDVP